MGDLISLTGALQAQVAKAVAEIPPFTGRIHILEQRPPGAVFVSTTRGLHMPSCIPYMETLRRGFEDGIKGKTLVACGVELTPEQFLSPQLVLPLLSVVIVLRVEDARVELVPDFKAATGWTSRCFISTDTCEVRKQARSLIRDLTTRNTVCADPALGVLVDLHTSAGFETDMLDDFDVRIARYAQSGQVEA